MWLARQMRSAPPTADADMGVTTIAGDRVGVLTRGEVRELPVYGPGGYVWLPENGAEVLVIKGGPGGEEQCVAGTAQSEAPRDMQPGDLSPWPRRQLCLPAGKWCGGHSRAADDQRYSVHALSMWDGGIRNGAEAAKRRLCA